MHNVLSLAAQHGLQLFCPSSIAVFGANAPRHKTPDDAPLQPTTVYGITKVR